MPSRLGSAREGVGLHIVVAFDLEVYDCWGGVAVYKWLVDESRTGHENHFGPV